MQAFRGEIRHDMRPYRLLTQQFINGLVFHHLLRQPEDDGHPDIVREIIVSSRRWFLANNASAYIVVQPFANLQEQDLRTLVRWILKTE